MDVKNMKNMKMSGSMMVFLGAVFWSLNSPVVKFLSLDAYLMCGLRALIAGISLAAFIRPKQLKWNGWMLLYVCSYAALSLSIILSLKLTSAPVAIGMQYTAIIWLFLFSVFQTKVFRFRGFVPVIVIFVGVILFMCSGTDGASSTGNLIALFEGVFFAFMSVGSKKVAGRNPIGLTAVANLFTGILILALFPASTATMSGMSGMDWFWMLILGVIQIGFGYAFYNMGIQKVSAQKASILALWEMILGPVWVALFLREYPTVPVVIGFVIIIAGLILDVKLNSVEAGEA